MTRPEHVRCENCCFWWVEQDHLVGECRRGVPIFIGPTESVGEWLKTASCEFCGEFRESWPEHREPHESTLKPQRLLCGACGGYYIEGYDHVCIDSPDLQDGPEN